MNEKNTGNDCVTQNSTFLLVVSVIIPSEYPRDFDLFTSSCDFEHSSTFQFLVLGPFRSFVTSLSKTNLLIGLFSISASINIRFFICLC
mmetsp:Transcript_17890/g.23155  ORF Transcript_17890/g.23155 Transcript_17890/m.23155 type:complete len:89 (+) Transcript_17890:746-1012(+)